MKLSVRFDFGKIIALLGGIFVVLKVYDAYWVQSGAIGGFWNYIQVFYVIAAFVLFFINYQVCNNALVGKLLLYAWYSFIISTVSLSEISVSTIYYLMMILFAPSVLILFCFVGHNNTIDSNKFLLLVYYIVSALAIMSYLYYFVGTKSLKGDGAKVYYAVGLLPLALLYTKRFKSLPIIVAITAALLSAKRGALIAVLLMMIVWIVSNNKKEGKTVQQTVKAIFLLLMIAVFVFIAFNYIDQNINSNLLYKFEKLSYDGGSGRMDRWLSVLDTYSNSRFFNKVFGHGNDAVVNTFGYHVHNDFIEVLYNYGIIGTILYALFFIELFKTYFRMHKDSYEHSGIFAMSIVFSACLATYSFYIVDPNYIICSMMTFGLLIADYERGLANSYFSSVDS